MEKEKWKIRPAWIVLTGLVSAGILAFGLLLVFISIQEGKVAKKAEDLKDDFDAVIVLGAQVKPDGEPSVQLAWRLDTAAEVWKMKNVPVVVCGAKGKDEPEEEAYAMKRYLEGKGIPPDMLLTDPDSFNTEQNLKHAKKLLDEYHIAIWRFHDHMLCAEETGRTQEFEQRRGTAESDTRKLTPEA